MHSKIDLCDNYLDVYRAEQGLFAQTGGIAPPARTACRVAVS